MGKIFNVSAACDPDLHYMVDITDKLMQIRRMVDAGQYFIINRARQYGKTTTLRELEKILKKDYIVVSLDFQMLGAASFQTENIFSLTFARIFLRAAQRQKDENTDRYRQLLDALGTAVLEKRPDFVLQELFEILSDICGASCKPMVLSVDEVDSASNNQVFLDFLAQLRAYLVRNENRVISKQELFEQVWEDRFTGDGTLNVHIRKLREAIEKDPGRPEYILTVWGDGYRFCGNGQDG